MAKGHLGIQALKRLTLGFGSGHDLMVREFDPHIRLRAEGAEPAWDSFSLSLPLSHFLCFSLSLKINT